MANLNRPGARTVANTQVAGKVIALTMPRDPDRSGTAVEMTDAQFDAAFSELSRREDFRSLKRHCQGHYYLVEFAGARPDDHYRKLVAAVARKVGYI